MIRWRESYFARTYRLEISTSGGSNDSEWTVVYTNNAGAAGVQDVTFASPFAARYFRIRMTRNNKSNYRIAELECYAGAPKVSFGEPQLLSTASPETFELLQNFPNPFNPSTNISFSLPQETHVALKIFDLVGLEIASLVNGRLQPGTYTVPFDSGNLPSGIYFCVMQTGEARLVRRLTLMK